MKSGFKYTIGVDLHKSVIQICVLDSAGEVCEEQRHSIVTLEQGLKVMEGLEKWRKKGRLVVEAIGVNRWFVNACLEKGWKVAVADPAKLGLRMLGKKTDRRDAYELARRLWMGDIDRNATTYYPTDEEYGFRKLLRVRHKLVGIRQRLVNQIRGMLNAYKVRSPSGCLYTPRRLSQLRDCVFPTDEMDMAFESLVDCLESIQAAIEKLTKRIEKSATRSVRIGSTMEMLPSVGPQTAMTLAYELGDVSRFRNSKTAAAYVGLVPRVADSADKHHHGRVTKRGNGELRWILSEWAVRLMAKNPIAKAWAAPRLKRMHKNKVRIALARRLLIGLYILFTRGEVFSLERCLAS
jgi:transposase